MQSYSRTISDLGAITCRCGEIKDRRRFFCRSCYWRLPESYRKRLWRRYGTQNALCTIYTRALAFLGLLGPEGKAA
jgi:hypothetical protein